MEAKKKTGGREKNTPNKTTAEAKQLFKEILASQGLHVEQSLNKLREESNEKFLNCFTKLVGFYMPKMSESQNTIEVSQPNKEFNIKDVLNSDSDNPFNCVFQFTDTKTDTND